MYQSWWFRHWGKQIFKQMYMIQQYLSSFYLFLQQSNIQFPRAIVVIQAEILMKLYSESEYRPDLQHAAPEQLPSPFRAQLDGQEADQGDHQHHRVPAPAGRGQPLPLRCWLWSRVRQIQHFTVHSQEWLEQAVARASRPPALQALQCYQPLTETVGSTENWDHDHIKIHLIWLSVTP